MTQGSLCFSDLPDACVVEVLKRLDERSALTFQSTSKWVLGLAQWSTIWASKLEALCGLKVASWHLKGSKELQRALRELFDILKSPKSQDAIDDDSYLNEEILNFHGLATDGGLQDGQTSYWMGNIFEYGLSKGYCSTGKLDRAINCVGVYIPSRSLTRKGILPMRSYQPSACADSKEYPIVVDEGESHLYDEKVMTDLQHSAEGPASLSILRRVVVCRKGRFSCPVTSGSLSVGSADWSEVTKKGSHAEQASTLYSETQSGCVPVLGKLKSLEAVVAACEEGKILPGVVSWGATGEWVEFESRGFGPRPVLWYNFYSETEYKNRQSMEETNRRAKLTARFLNLGASCKTVDLKRQKVFKTRTFMSFERNRLSMQLSRPVPGNMLCITLNSFEDIMDQCTWDQSKGPNVDIGKIYLSGSKRLSIFDP